MSTNVSQADVIDRLLELQPGDPLHTLRHARKKVVDATQSFHELAFDAPELDARQREDRFLVAAITAQETGPSTLADEYQNRLLHEIEPESDRTATEALQALLDGQSQNVRPALNTLADYARALAREPATADRNALLKLNDAGWSVPEVVSLAQIMGYVSYQGRMMIGLSALEGMAEAVSTATEPVKDSGFVHPAHLPAPGERLDINGYTNTTLDWKAWLPIQDVEQLTQKQSAILDTSHPTARESDYYMLLIRAPELLEQRSLVYNAIMYAPGGAPRHERELGSATVSRINGCIYCTSVHAQRFEQLAKRNDVIAQLFSDPRTAGTSARERAIIQAAIALTEDPKAFGPHHLQPMAAQGITPEQMRDILSSIAIFAWANRLMMNLGEHVMPSK